MATTGIHFWKFQVFNSGAEGLVVLLFWLDLWEIFFMATVGFGPRTSGFLVLHSTTAPQQLLVFISDYFRVFNSGAEGLVVVLFWLDLSEIFFLGHTGLWTWDLWISSPALYHCATVTSGLHLWQFQVFNSGAEGMVVVLFWLDLWDIFFLATPGFEPRTYVSLVHAPYHCTMVTSAFHLWQFKVFNSGAEMIGGGIVLIGPVRDFLFGHTGVWTQEPLVIFNPALYHCAMATSGFHLWQFQVFNSGAEGLVVILFWLDLWEIFFLATPGFEPQNSGSLVLHSTTVPWWLLVFISDNLRYITLVQRDWWWYCSDWTCQRFSFWQHQSLNPGPLDL